MTDLSKTPTAKSTGSTSTPVGNSGAQQLRSGSQRKVGYHTGVGQLTPYTGGDKAPATTTIGGATISLPPRDTDFVVLEAKLGPVWAKKARLAAKDGGAAVVALLEPHLTVAMARLPIVHELADVYARWAVKQPPLKDATKTPTSKEADAKKTLALGQYGLMVDLEAGLGKSLGVLAPSPGRSVGVHAAGAVSVEGIYLGMTFDLEAEHEDDGFTVAGSASFAIGVGTTAENASLVEKLSITGHGDDAVAAMHMVGLVIERWLREQQFDWKNPSWDEFLRTGKKFLVNVAAFEAAGPFGILGAEALALAGGKIADALWGKNFERDVAATMDDDDYGESTIGVGVGLSGGGEDVELGVEVGYAHGTHVGKGESGELESTSSDVLSGGFSLKVKGGGVELGLAGSMSFPLAADSAAVALQLDIQRSGKEPPLGNIVRDLVKSNVLALAQRTTRRAGPFIGRVAEALSAVMAAQEVASALAGTAGLRVSVDYDTATGKLAIAVTVVKELGFDEDAEAASVEVSFEVGQEIYADEFDVGRI